MNIFRRTLDKRERDAGTGGDKVEPKKEKPKGEKPKKTMTQAEFSGYKKGGMVKGDGCATKGKTRGKLV